jgi:hypothetical protein
MLNLCSVSLRLPIQYLFLRDLCAFVVQHLFTALPKIILVAMPPVATLFADPPKIISSAAVVVAKV